MANPVLANGLAGLATSATAQATVEVKCSLVLFAPVMADTETRAPIAAPNCYLQKDSCSPPCFGPLVCHASWETKACQLHWTSCICMQRVLLWERRNNTVEPFGETVQQVYARISALRDRLDGPVVTPQHDFPESSPDLAGIASPAAMLGGHKGRCWQAECQESWGCELNGAPC